MSDPLPAPSFNPTYSVQPTDIGSGYAAGIEQAEGDGKVPVARQLPPMPNVPSRQPHHLPPTSHPIDTGLAKASQWNAWPYQDATRSDPRGKPDRRAGRSDR